MKVVNINFTLRYFTLLHFHKLRICDIFIQLPKTKYLLLFTDSFPDNDYSRCSESTLLQINKQFANSQRFQIYFAWVGFPSLVQLDFRLFPIFQLTFPISVPKIRIRLIGVRLWKSRGRYDSLPERHFHSHETISGLFFREYRTKAFVGTLGYHYLNLYFTFRQYVAHYKDSNSSTSVVHRQRKIVTG